MRIGGFICLIVAVALVGLALLRFTQAEGEYSLGAMSAYLLPGVLMVLLGLWLFQQPKAPPSDDDEGSADSPTL